VLRGAEVQALLLRSLGLALDAAASGEPAPPAMDRAAAAALLRPLWKRVRRGARDIAAAEPDDLHTLRKRAKRLRYLLEALAPLLPPKRLRRTLAALKPALDRLGELNDLHTARTRLAAHPEPAPPVWFALGLLAERHRHGLPVAQRALAAVFEAPPPWR
jgi:CHAD domain-containing protein